MSLPGVTIASTCGPIGSGKTFFADALRREYNFTPLAFATSLKLLCKPLVCGIDDPLTDEAKAERVDLFPCLVHGCTLKSYLCNRVEFSYVAEVLETSTEELVTFTLETLNKQGPRVTSDTITYPSGWTFRTVIQIVGTEVFRYKYGADVWIRMVRREINDLIKKGYSRFVITDVRYPNEADFIHELGGFVLKLSISPDVTFKRNDGGIASHASETELGKIVGDFNVQNDYTLIPLRQVLAYVSAKMNV